jgi:dipeptidyl aminopeptidase/acylaminoacyl peptidase
MSRKCILFLLIPALLAIFLVIGCSQRVSEVKSPPSVESALDQGKYIPDVGTFLEIGANAPSGYSWDGDKLFFNSKMSGSMQVYRITEDGWPYQLTTFEDGIDFFSLSNNSELAIVGASVGGSEQSQLYLMDTETGRIQQLSDFEDVKMGSVVWSNDDKFIYYRSNQENKRDFFIYKMDILTTESEEIFENPGWNVISNISEDNSKLIITNYTSNVNNDLYLLDLASGESTKLNEDDKDVRYYAPVLMPDNETIWLVCDNNEDGIMRLATMQLGSPEVTFVDDDWIDPRWEIEGFGLSRDYKYMGAQYNENGYNRIKIREAESKKELPSPPLDGLTEIFDFDKFGNVLIEFMGPTRAPDVWTWNPHKEELKQRTFSKYAGIDRTMFRDPKLITYKSFDGLEIPAFLYLPPDYKEGEAIPFIISAHGGPESQFQPVFIRNFQYLMLNGYGILAPNPRGSSGYGREYLNMDNYKNRKKSLKDYKAAVDWLFEKGYTKEGMLGIRGGSYGGYVVLGMITEYPDIFDAAIDIVGIANFETFLKNTKPYRRALRESEYGPLTDPEFLKEISPIHKAHLIKTPLLVIHGANDPRVPLIEATQIIKAVNDNNGIVDSLIFYDEGHGSGKTENVIIEYRKHVKFLNKYLKK